MNIFDERISVLQSQMKRDGIKAYIIKATDPHMSEMYAKRFGAERFYFCSFKGEDGTLLVTQDKNYLYTDGRYWVEAEGALKGTSCQLVYMGKLGVPSMVSFIKDNDLYPLGLDASLFGLSEIRSLFVDKDHPIKSLDYSFLVKDMPALPKDKIFKIDQKFLSKTRNERVSSILCKAEKENAKDVLLTALDDISYVLGYRGNDIDCTPVFYSYLYINSDHSLDLFIDSEKLPDSFKEEKNIRIHPYADISTFLDTKEDTPISIDPKRVNALLCSHIRNRVYQTSPAYLDKAVKGPAEIENIKRVHEIDGVAVLKLMKYIEDNVESGFLNEKKCADYVDAIRLADKDCFELSFGTIAAADSNAAMMHYAPTSEVFSPLTSFNQLLLVDSGGQYYGGTTDITRTFLVNKEPSKEVIHDYTLTLKSQIALSTSIFEAGASGHSIDIKAREVMWKEGLDYKCGTGHGVGYISCVHEGPVGFRFYDSIDRDDKGVLQPGHIITIEPGVYKSGKYGIRLENELLVVPAFESPDGVFYKFETITYCPYDLKGIDISLLSDDEINWVNSYNKMVFEKLSPLIHDQDLLAFLKKTTGEIVR